MSRASFPRPEHAALLREQIAQWLRTRQVALEISERGLDHYRCCYRFGFRRSPAREWSELPIHFQVAERLEGTRNGAELHRILDSFLDRHFVAGAPNNRSA